MPTALINPEILSYLRSPSTGKPLREALPQEMTPQQKISLVEKRADGYLTTTDGEEFFPIQGEIVNFVVPEK